MSHLWITCIRACQSQTWHSLLQNITTGNISENGTTCHATTQAKITGLRRISISHQDSVRLIPLKTNLSSLWAKLYTSKPLLIDQSDRRAFSSTVWFIFGGTNESNFDTFPLLQKHEANTARLQNALNMMVQIVYFHFTFMEMRRIRNRFVLVSFNSHLIFFFWVSESPDVACQPGVNGGHHVGDVPVDDGCVHRYSLKDAELKWETLESHQLTVSGDFSPIFDLPFTVTITFHYSSWVNKPTKCQSL